MIMCVPCILRNVDTTILIQVNKPSIKTLCLWRAWLFPFRGWKAERYRHIQIHRVGKSRRWTGWLMSPRRQTHWYVTAMAQSGLHTEQCGIVAWCMSSVNGHRCERAEAAVILLISNKCSFTRDCQFLVNAPDQTKVEWRLVWCVCFVLQGC